MEDLTILVARNLKKMREEKKLSLDKLADLTGVSKSMLGQIERGESSPTISTI
jgi:XRE family transcriptional regulator, regulator of sulfur utilization